MPHPLEQILQKAIGELKEMVGADTIIGSPVSAGDNTTILPVSRVSLGFVSGGGEYGTKSFDAQGSYFLDGSRPYPFTGAVTAGVSAVPVAFLTIQNGEVRLLPATQDEPLSRVLSALPELMRELTDMICDLKGKKA